MIPDKPRRGGYDRIGTNGTKMKELKNMLIMGDILVSGFEGYADIEQRKWTSVYYTSD